MTDARRTVLRVRERRRGQQLAGFDPALAPQAWEWGIDRFQMSVKGRWSAEEDGRVLFQDRLDSPFGMDWFGQPQAIGNKIRLNSLKDGRSTFGALTAQVFDVHQDRGTIHIRLHANPTRTLAHLWARHGEAENFADLVTRLRPDEFFQLAEQDDRTFGLDAKDNLLSNHADMRESIGSDIFEHFLPVYVNQLQRVFFALLTLGEDAEIIGTTHVLRSAQGRIIVDWGEATVPQVEPYFERYHPYAQSAVRRGAGYFLAADHHVRVRTYPPHNIRSSFETTIASQSRCGSQTLAS